jgi:thiazole synthase ThiGH ThiG subunit
VVDLLPLPTLQSERCVLFEVWFMDRNRYFNCRGLQFTRLWHCFGNAQDTADASVMEELLTVSGSNVLPINTHRLSRQTGWAGLELGYAGVSLRAFASHQNLTSMVMMLNINLRTSTLAAADTAKFAVELTGYKVIKLEVLDQDLKRSNQKALVAAARELLRWDDSLLVLPLLGNDLATAQELSALGCPLLRVMGSPIGSGKGILDEATLEHICSLGLPVILDGGVGDSDHVRRAFACGVTGVLINSMLFGAGRHPVEVMRRFVADFTQIVQEVQPPLAQLPAF